MDVIHLNGVLHLGDTSRIQQRSGYSKIGVRTDPPII